MPSGPNDYSQYDGNELSIKSKDECLAFFISILNIMAMRSVEPTPNFSLKMNVLALALSLFKAYSPLQNIWF